MDKLSKCRGTVLYVENDPDAYRSITELLEDNGCLVVHFDSGREAIESIEGGLRYRLALVDLALGGGGCDGHDVIRRSKEVNSRTPVFCVSGYSRGVPLIDGRIRMSHVQGEIERMLDRYLPWDND